MACAALSAPDTKWNFCPSTGASVFFCVLFLLTTAAHLVQAVRYRAAYCWVVVMSGVWQLLTYGFRTASIQAPASFGLYAAWFVLILIAPLWTNAFAYMVFGRLVASQTPGQAVWGLRASWFGPVFVVLDIVAFLVQIYGAARAAINSDDTAVMLAGLHVYMVGVGIQLLFLLICAAFSLRLAAVMWTRGRHASRSAPPRLLLSVQFAVMVLIVVRIVFRIAEYSSGLDSTVPSHEAYQYCLDSLPMFVALVLYNVVHPGRILSGPQPDIPVPETPVVWRAQGYNHGGFELGSRGSQTADELRGRTKGVVYGAEISHSGNP